MQKQAPGEVPPATAAAPCSAGAMEEQRRDAEPVQAYGFGYQPAPQASPQLSRNKVSLAEMSVCAEIWQESNTSSPTAFHAQPARVLGDPHLTTQSLRLLQLPMAFPHRFVAFTSQQLHL